MKITILFIEIYSEKDIVKSCLKSGPILLAVFKGKDATSTLSLVVSKNKVENCSILLDTGMPLRGFRFDYDS